MSRKTKTVGLDEFTVDQDMSMPKRIAAHLNWAATVAPGRPVSYQMLAKVCFFMGRLPAENDGRVEAVKRASRRAKNILMDQYNRGIVAHPGHGIRATIDSSDVAQTQYENDARRIASSIRAADRTRAIIRTSEIQDKELRNRVNNMNTAVRVLISPDLINRLLPKKEEESE